MPGGNSHWMIVGMPDAPEFFQYVCQPGDISSRTAAVMVVPGLAEAADKINVARVAAASVVTANEASNSASKNVKVRFTSL